MRSLCPADRKVLPADAQVLAAGDAVKYTLMVNTSGLHTLPAALREANSALLRGVSGGASGGLDVANHPFPKTHELLRINNELGRVHPPPISHGSCAHHKGVACSPLRKMRCSCEQAHRDNEPSDRGDCQHISQRPARRQQKLCISQPPAAGSACLGQCLTVHANASRVGL